MQYYSQLRPLLSCCDIVCCVRSQNIGLGVIPMIVGTLQPSSTNVRPTAYDRVEMFFIVISACGALFALWLNIENYIRPYPVLNLPEAAISELVKSVGDLGKLPARGKRSAEATHLLSPVDSQPQLEQQQQQQQQQHPHEEDLVHDGQASVSGSKHERHDGIN